MKKSELLRLSFGQVGMVLSYNVLTMNLQDYFQKTAFSPYPDLAWLYAFSIITIAFTAGAFTYLFAGWLSDKTYLRWGRRPYLLFSIPGAVALTLLGLNYISLPLASVFILLSCLATIYMVTYRIMYTSYFAIYQDLTAPEDRVKTTVIFTIFGVIGIAGAIVIPLAPSDPNGNYVFVTLICSLIYVATVLFAFFFGPKEDIERKQEKFHQQPGVLKAIKETFKDKNFKNYAISAFFSAFTYSMVMFILKPFLDWKTNPTLDHPRPTVIPISFMLILGTILPIALCMFYFCNYASKRWGKRTFFKRTLMFGFISFPVLMFLSNQGSPISLIVQLYIVIIIILFVVIVTLSLQNAILMDITPEGKEATYTGVFFFFVVIPFPIASQLAGTFLTIFDYNVSNFWFGTQDGSDFAYGILSVIMALALFLSWLFLRRVKYEEVLER
ncbi:MAG: MFS transporter [Candidatus Helarchaeota archaeon]